MLKALWTTITLLVACTCLYSQDIIRGSDKPTPAQVQAAADTLKRMEANPNQMAIGGYGFIEVVPGEKAYWNVMPGTKGVIDREFVPKGTVVKAWYVAKGEKVFSYQTIPSSDKDRYIVKAIQPGPATLLKVVPGATPDIEPTLSYYHFQLGDEVIPPPVTPVDPPPVTPVDPPPVTPIVEKFGFTSLVINESVKVPVAARFLAPAIAANFDKIAEKIKKNPSLSSTAANIELREINRATMGDHRPSWLPLFQTWQALADKHEQTGKMATSADYATAYTETATGLRKVK